MQAQAQTQDPRPAARWTPHTIRSEGGRPREGIRREFPGNPSTADLARIYGEPADIEHGEGIQEAVVGPLVSVDRYDDGTVATYAVGTLTPPPAGGVSETDHSGEQLHPAPARSDPSAPAPAQGGGSGGAAAALIGLVGQAGKAAGKTIGMTAKGAVRLAASPVTVPMAAQRAANRRLSAWRAEKLEGAMRGAREAVEGPSGAARDIADVHKANGMIEKKPRAPGGRDDTERAQGSAKRHRQGRDASRGGAEVV